MHIISTGKQTVLSDFADLETKSSYPHSNSETTTDFQFYTRQRIFVEVNKKSGLEILRVKENEEKLDIQRVRKLTIENAYCVACTKQSLEDMAFGLSNGHVRLYNYKKADFVHRFKTDNIRNSVIYLDYNITDDYLSAVYENGQIFVYGIKTKTKIDTVNIDGSSTLARFHPIKRFQLSVASSKGAVTIYDVQSKKKLFNSIDSHAAPCRDLCISAATPHNLLSVGYDCIINIFDTRKRSSPTQIKSSHPLSCCAVSDCGLYFSVGDLTGEIATYDMRNVKECLASKKIHDFGVTRMLFLPNENEKNTMSLTNAENHSVDDSIEENSDNAGELKINTRKSSTKRDSFCDFLDFQSNRAQDKSINTPRRDSFDWESLARRPSIGSLLGTISSENNSTVSNSSSEGRLPNLEYVNTRERGGLRDRSNTTNHHSNIKLMQIQEEHTISNCQYENSPGSDKENSPIKLELGRRLQILPADRNSTPNYERNSMEGILAASKNKMEEPEQATVSAKMTETMEPAQHNSDVVTAIAELRKEMNEKFHQLEMEMKMHMEQIKWQLLSYDFKLWDKQTEHMDEIQDMITALLQNDPFVNEFVRLKEENEKLKEQLNKNK